MYCIMFSLQGTMTVVSMLSVTYAEMIHLNYTVLATGTKRAMEMQLEEMDYVAGW